MAKTQKWGYEFIYGALNKFISNIQGDSVLTSNPEFRDRRNIAQNLMTQLAGNQPQWFYVSRQKSGKEPGEEILDLILATDRPNFILPDLLQQHQKTLLLSGSITTNSDNGLRIIYTDLIDLNKGKQNKFNLLCLIKFLPNYYHNCGVPQDSVAKILALPQKNEPLPTAKQSTVWEAFINVQRKIASDRLFCVPYSSHNYGVLGQKVTFEVEITKATIHGQSQNPLKVEEFWNRAEKALNEEIKLLPATEKNNHKPFSQIIGNLEGIDRHRQIMRIKLDRDVSEQISIGCYKLPNQGYLIFESVGNLVQIAQQEKALESLQQGKSINPNLDKFFFDAAKARPAREIIKLKPEDLLLASANSEQIAAVETVLAAPDLALIQGPPGTGKTTVIAEICYQVALRGGTTMIASTTNLAVDNALSHLVYHPNLRVLRKGKVERVEEEGLDFLEDKIINKWLRDTAKDCEDKLKLHQDNVATFEDLLASIERFDSYLMSETNLTQQEQELLREKQSLESALATLTTNHQQTLKEQIEWQSLGVTANKLLPPHINWQTEAVRELMAKLQPLFETDSKVTSFIGKVTEAKDRASRLGWKPPHTEVFALAMWLETQILESIVAFKMMLSHVKGTSKAINDYQESAKTYTHYAGNLQEVKNKLKITYQEKIKQQEELEKLKQPQQQVVKAITTLENNQTDYLEVIINNLKICFEGDIPFTETSLEFPSEIITLCDLYNLTKVNIWQELVDDIKNELKVLTKKKYESAKVVLLHQQIYMLLTQIPTSVEHLQIEAQDIERWQQALGSEIYSLSPKEALERLRIITKQSVDEVNKINSGVNITEETLTIKNQIYYTIAKLEAVKKLYPEIAKKAVFNDEAIQIQLRHLAHKVFQEFMSKSQNWREQVIRQNASAIHIQEQQINDITQLHQKHQKALQEAQTKLENYRQQANSKLKIVLQQLQSLVLLPQLPQGFKTSLENLLKTPGAIATEGFKILSQLQNYEFSLNQLELLINSLAVREILSHIQQILNTQVVEKQKVIETQQQEIKATQEKLEDLESQKQKLRLQLGADRTWWGNAFRSIPARLQPTIPAAGLFDRQFLAEVKSRFETWKQELTKEKAYLGRYEKLVSDWIKKLRQPSEQDLNQLKSIYINNTNVIGITCDQAAFSSNEFDVVIIDEVNKCTPAELLIPALKAKKLVLIGDYRQLPPMFNTKTLEEMAVNLGMSSSDFSIIQESLFKAQFEAANDTIKSRFTIQYRMHPLIMGGINQFYDHQLQCGLANPDVERAHHLQGKMIQNNHHLMWFTTPQQQEFFEQKQGTSFINPQEVEVIKKLCQEIESAWSGKIAQGNPRKEVGIITFYRAQWRLIEENLDPLLFPSLHITTGTVDRFQGIDKAVVIVSLVRNNNRQDLGFAKKTERLNVAFSRAKELLAIVGCHSLFTQAPEEVGKMYAQVSNFVQNNGGLVDVSRVI